jgi:hypothetical protein
VLAQHTVAWSFFPSLAWVSFSRAALRYPAIGHFDDAARLTRVGLVSFSSSYHTSPFLAVELSRYGYPCKTRHFSTHYSP